MKTTQRIFLKDGVPVNLRPLKPQDIDLLDEMHTQVSEQSIYNRYLRPHVPTRAELEAMCSLPKEKGSAFIALIDNPGQQAIGMGYYVVDGQSASGASSAEPAILIADAYQGKGLGGLVFGLMCKDAISRGVDQFVCYLHTANEPCLKLIRRSGYSYTGHYAYGTREIYIDLRTEQVLW